MVVGSLPTTSHENESRLSVRGNFSAGCRKEQAGSLCSSEASPLLLFPRGLDDLGEAARIEAGAADEGAVDVGLGH
jgi:hypothetical protein